MAFGNMLVLIGALTLYRAPFWITLSLVAAGMCICFVSKSRSGTFHHSDAFLRGNRIVVTLVFALIVLVRLVFADRYFAISPIHPAGALVAAPLVYPLIYELRQFVRRRVGQLDKDRV